MILTAGKPGSLDKTSPPPPSPHSKKTKAQLIEELTALEGGCAAPNADQGATFSSGELFHASFNASTSLMAVTLADNGVQIDVNNAWQEVLGYTRDEVVGKTSLELGIWHNPDQRQVMLDALEKDGVVRDFRATLQAKNGVLHECLINLNLLDTDEKYLLFSAYDITVLKNLQDEARQVEKRHEIAAKQAKIAFWRWSFGEKRLTDWSEVHARINPCRGAIPGTYDDILAQVHPDDRKSVHEAYLKSDKNLNGFDIEYRIITAEREVRWLREYAEVEYDDSGVAIAQIGFDQDITEIKQVQESLRYSHGDLEKRVEERTRELDEEIERRREITRQLRERDAQYAQAERIANIHNWTSNATFDVALSYSRNAEKMFGLPREFLLGNHFSFLAYVHQGDQARIENIYSRITESPEPYEIEYRFCPPDGDIIHLLEAGEPVYDEDGTLIHFRGTTQDITSRVERDEELHRNSIMAQQAAKLAGLGHWVWDEIENRCISCSDETPALYGLTMDEFMGTKTGYVNEMEWIHPNDRERLIEIYKRCLARSEDYEAEFRVVHPDGSVHWLRDIGTVYETVNSQAKSTIGTVRDITREKMAQQALEESESRNRAIVETAADAIITIDEHGIIKSFNRAAERIFGFQAGNVIGKNVEYLMPEPFASNHDEYLKNYMRTGSAKIIGIGREVEGLRKDGSTFPMLLAVSEIETTGERVFTGIIRDISDYKEAEKRAIAAKEEAERANEAKTEFMAHMSHEFRTPLNAIIGFSETMSNQIFGDLGHPKYDDYVGDILNSGHLLLHIVNDILDISKVEAGEMALSEDRFLPADIIQECITTVRGLSEQATGLMIEYKDKTPSRHLLADARIFKQILLNLLSNAVKFTPADGRITVTTSSGDNGGFVVQILDTGCGIAEEDLAVVIEPFGQSRSGSQTAHKGTGLGLSLSKILTDLHDGTLTLESELGKGTTVTLSFPPERSVQA